MSAVGHVHVYGPSISVDHCHYIEEISVCECGHAHHAWMVREFVHDPLAVAFADENCQTCRDLLRGMEPPSWT